MTDILTPPLVVVSDLIVQVATCETCYANENGFSAHWAEFTTTDPLLQARLADLAAQNRQVLLRCALLDVTGRVTKVESTKEGSRFVFSIDDLIYRRLEAARNVV